jgi:hypothetical protein
MGIGAAPVKKAAANTAAAKRGAANTAAAKRGAVNIAAAKRGAANAAAKKRAASKPGKKRRGRPKQNSSSSDEDSVQSEEDSEEDDEAEHSYDDAEEEQGDDTSATKQEEEGCGMVETGQDGEGARGDNKDTEADVDDYDEEEVTKYKVGDAVRTVNGLVASVVAVNVQSGTYDIKYRNKGDVDENVHPKFFKPYAPPTRKRTAESKKWDYREEPVESMQEYIARTGVSAEFNVLPPDVKRRRG